MQDNSAAIEAVSGAARMAMIREQQRAVSPDFRALLDEFEKRARMSAIPPHYPEDAENLDRAREAVLAAVYERSGDAQPFTYLYGQSCAKCGKPVHPPTSRYTKATAVLGDRIWHGDCFPETGVSGTFTPTCTVTKSQRPPLDLSDDVEQPPAHDNLRVPSELLFLLSDPLMGPAITRFVADVRAALGQQPATEEAAKALVKRLRDTPNWSRESWGGSWKNTTTHYDRAPFEAADMIEKLSGGGAVPVEDHAVCEHEWISADHPPQITGCAICAKCKTIARADEVLPHE